MTVDEAAKKIWDYMLMHHELKKADAIIVPGNSNLKTIEYAARLYREGWAALVVCSGSGTINAHLPGRDMFKGTTEAAVFADIARREGVPEQAIIKEDESQNTNDNLRFSLRKLAESGVQPRRLIAVMKPYMERRMVAIAQAICPRVECIVTSPQITFEEYPGNHPKDYVINMLVGDLQRIEEYPKRGWQAPQEIPADVRAAYEFLISKGYTERLIK